MNNFGKAFFLALAFSVTIYAQVHEASPISSGSNYVPQRVYDAKTKKFSDFETMLAELARAEIVFVGEQHDDANTHRLERAILEGILRRQRPVTVAFEMFERDTQTFVNEYLAGNLSEEGFLKVSRPWPNYAKDYRPLLELAKAHQWKVIAGNVPRRLASQVSRTGLKALDSLPADERKYVAAEQQCPMDDYFKRFTEAMTAHPSDNKSDNANKDDSPEAKKKAEEEAAKLKAMTERFYFAQCVKDETMAESIVQAYNQAPINQAIKPVIVHFNGAFHSDYKLGTTARTSRRLPKAIVKVVSIVPLENLDSINVDEFRKRGDYVLFTYRPRKVEATATPK